jgi:hypothetical protein
MLKSGLPAIPGSEAGGALWISFDSRIPLC